MYDTFRDPPRQYSMRPFWFWIGEIDPAGVERQIAEMVDKGVYGAYVHARSGLRTPYLGERWWEAIAAGLRRSAELGFQFGIIDEFNWPSGEARDFWLSGTPSRVLQANPAYRMRELDYVERHLRGPAAVEWALPRETQVVVAAPVRQDGTLDGEGILDLSAAATEGTLRWQAPPGAWLLMAFHLVDAVGADGGLVDLMNPDAVREFIAQVHEQYHRRFAAHFGRALPGFYVDHEGDYGGRIAWTPRLFARFQARTGYDLRPLLPLLVHEGGRLTPKVRCDYLDTCGELYAEAFFGQVSAWCRAHGLSYTGHVWEESLQLGAAANPDHFRILRTIDLPGVDSLFEWGRSPRAFKEAASVAHFRGTGFSVENQGVQGINGYLDPQGMRRGTNAIAAWGPTLFIPHAFNYHPDRVDWPEDWFVHQPYWPFVRHYADMVRRISYMNSGGRHVADLLLYHPIEAVWAHSDAIFNHDRPFVFRPPRIVPEQETDYRTIFLSVPNLAPLFRWENQADHTEDVYTALMEQLVAAQRDFDVADAHYLAEARIEGGALAIGEERFRALILPPMTTVRRSTIRRAREFAEAGGLVIAFAPLPTASMEAGRDDPDLAAELAALFAIPGDSARSTERSHPRGGRALVVREVGEALALLDASLERDVQVVEGDGRHLIASHRVKEGRDLYWLVNDSAEELVLTVRLRARGRPERWDATSGERAPVFYTTSGAITDVRLRFAPWDACYLVFDPEPAPQPARLVGTSFDDLAVLGREDGRLRLLASGPAGPDPHYVEIEEAGRRRRLEVREGAGLAPLALGPEWRFRPLAATVPVPYARGRLAPAGAGEAQGYHLPAYNDRFWEQRWLSAERLTAREWWLCGPFDYDNHRGFDRVFPPERAIDLVATYDGAEGRTARWRRVSSPTRVVQLDPVFGTEHRPWITGYALGYVFAPAELEAELRVVADNNLKLWLNDELVVAFHDHPFYFEMTESFGLRPRVRLRAGWNKVLLKVSKAVVAGSGGLNFTFRVADPEGRSIPGVRYAAEPGTSPPVGSPLPAEAAGERWYRVQVPPGTVALELPALPHGLTAYLGGERLVPDPSGVLSFGPGRGPAPRTLALRLDARDDLPAALHFRSGETAILLGSWTHNGLSHYVGSAAYETSFRLPPEFAGRPLRLDCGEVGVVVEAWLNGAKVGERPWLPFAFEVADAVRPGENHLRLVVTNTRAARRAVGEELRLFGDSVANAGPRLLERLEHNGLIGPVRLIPGVRTEVVLSAEC